MNAYKKIMVTNVTNWNGHLKFSKKNLKYEISKSANVFESELDINVYLSAYTALIERATKLLDAKHLVANLTCWHILPLKLEHPLRARVLG